VRGDASFRQTQSYGTSLQGRNHASKVRAAALSRSAIEGMDEVAIDSLIRGDFEVSCLNVDVRGRYCSKPDRCTIRVES
jgi:hypothetical protein